MEQKKNRDMKGIMQALWLLRGLLCAYAITGIMLLVMALLLYKLDISESVIRAGVIVTYVLSNLVGGFLVGKWAKTRKFVWGLILGILYFALLMAVSFGIYHTIEGGGTHAVTTLLLCAGGGMLGGMLS